MTDPELDAILNAARAAADAAQADYWDREAARQDAMGDLARAAGLQCPMPSKAEAEAMYPPPGGEEEGDT